MKKRFLIVAVLSPIFLIGMLFHLQAQSRPEFNQFIANNSKLPSTYYIALFTPITSPTTSNVALSYLRGMYECVSEHKSLYDSLGLKFAIFDDKSDTSLARTICRQLINDTNCLGIIGSCNSGCTNSIINEITNSNHKLPLLSAVSSASNLGRRNDWVFRLNLTDDKMVNSILDYILQTENRKEKLRVTSIYSNDYYGKNINNDLKETCLNNPNQLEYIEGGKYPDKITNIDYKKYVEDIIAQKPNVIGLFGQSFQCANFSKSIREANPNIITFGTTANSTNEFVSHFGPSAIEGVIIATSYSSASSSTQFSLNWKRRFEILFSVAPDNFAAQGYESIMTLNDALLSISDWKRLSYSERREKLRKAISTVSFVGILGPISFNNANLRLIDPAIMIWNKGRLVPANLYNKVENKPWILTEIGQTISAFLIVLILIIVLTIKSQKNIEKWAAVIAAVTSSVGFTSEGFRTMLGIEINVSLFTLLWLASFIILCILGILHPKTLIVLSKSQPFSLIMITSLNFQRFRKRVFSEYNKESIKRLQKLMWLSNNEKYIPIPSSIETSLTELDFYSSKESILVKKSEQDLRWIEPQPDILATEAITHTSTKIFYIEAPGGFGKSALTKFIAISVIEKFKLDDNPLCIWLPNTVEDIYTGITNSLKEVAKSDDILGQIILTTKIIAFIDGFSETKLSHTKLLDFLNSKKSDNIQLLISSRPDADLRKIILQNYSYVICNLSLLTSENLRTFVSNYNKARSNNLDELLLNIKAKLSNKKGFYLPLIIRLSLLIDPNDYESVADLYREVLRQLLSKKEIDTVTARDEVIFNVSEYCFSTYWQTGNRILLFADNNTSDKMLLSKLYSAGVLIPLDPFEMKASYSEPKFLKFFHDSIQTYLTARALVNKNSIEHTIKMAGDPIFLEKRDDTAEPYFSELFYMFIDIYPIPNQLFERLAKELIDYADKYDNHLTKGFLRKTFDKYIGSANSSADFKSKSIGILLNELIQRLKINSLDESNFRQCLKDLADIYSQVAPVIFLLLPPHSSVHEKSR